MRHCLTIEFMGDLVGDVGDTCHGEFPNLIRREEVLLNPDAIARKFANADVCDGSAISHTSDKIPGSRGLGRNNARRKGKGAGRKGRSEANCAELRESLDDIDNHHTLVEVGNWENDDYQESWGVRHVMCGTPAGRLIRQSI